MMLRAPLFDVLKLSLEDGTAEIVYHIAALNEAEHRCRRMNLVMQRGQLAMIWFVRHPTNPVKYEVPT